MPPNPPAEALQALLHDARLVRTLARSIAGSDADDLAQEACLVALQHPPAAGNVRGWFARVLQNLARQRRRGDHRRVRRERDAGADRTDRAPAAVDLVQRAAAHRAVVDAVLGLDELHRTPVLLRFFEDQPPRAIAARLGIPVATVHARIGRGLQRLRLVLEREHAPGSPHRDWRAALAPLPVLGRTFPSPLTAALPTATWIAAFAMKTKFVLAAAAALLAVALVVVPSLAPDRTVDAAPPATPAPAVAGGSAAPALPGDAGPRTEVHAVVPEAPAPRAAAGAHAVAGRAVDPLGRPLPRVAVELRSATGAPLRAATGDDGAFSFPAVASAERIVVVEPGWQTVLHAAVAGMGARFQLVVAARAVRLAGTVVDSNGRPAAGARLRVLWPETLRAQLSDNSDAASPEDLAAVADGNGAFRLVGAAVAGAQLSTSADGLLPDKRALPETDDGALRIVLAAPASRPDTVQGQVLDGHGVPQAGAWVALGSSAARTDERGTFVLDDGGSARQLQAAHAGHRRAVLARPEGGFAAFVTLTLGSLPLQIRGRVVDAAGQPLPGVRVWPLDGTLLADTRSPMLTEGIAQGAATMEMLMEQYRAGRITDPERTLRETPMASWPWTRTDADGRFTLGGLEERAYALRAMQDRTVLWVDVPDVQAGARDVVLRLPTDACLRLLRGRVVDHQGHAVGGVRMKVQCDAVRVGRSNMHAQGEARVVTGDDGSFELRDVPREHAYLRLDGEAILPLEFGRGAAGGLYGLVGGDPERVTLTVSARRHVQVELVDAARADGLLVLDGEGRPIVINVFQGRSRSEQERLQLAEGRSPVFVVPDTAATLVLQLGEAEVGRHALHLLPVDVNRLRL